MHIRKRVLCRDAVIAPPKCHVFRAASHEVGCFCSGACDAVPPQFCLPEPACYTMQLIGVFRHHPQRRFESAATSHRPPPASAASFAQTRTLCYQCIPVRRPHSCGEICHQPQGRFELTICGDGQYCHRVHRTDTGCSRHHLPARLVQAYTMLTMLTRSILSTRKYA